jgi:probable addiction module antidote protein
MTGKIDIDGLPNFDAADYLTTPDRQADYLSLVLEDGDEEEIRRALGAIARARGRAGLGDASGMNRESLGDDGNPAFSTVMELVRALGLKLTVQPL